MNIKETIKETVQTIKECVEQEKVYLNSTTQKLSRGSRAVCNNYGIRVFGRTVTERYTKYAKNIWSTLKK